jgi:hypothetical protein
MLTIEEEDTLKQGRRLVWIILIFSLAITVCIHWFGAYTLEVLRTKNVLFYEIIFILTGVIAGITGYLQFDVSRGVNFRILFLNNFLSSLITGLVVFLGVHSIFLFATGLMQRI